MFHVQVRSKAAAFINECSVKGNVMLCAVLSLMTIVLAFIMIIVTIRVRVINEQVIQIEDGIAVSSMAGMAVDFEQYAHTYMTGKTDVIISDHWKSYHNFCNSMWDCLNVGQMEQNGISHIQINRYILYNVIWNRNMLYAGDRRIEIFSFDKNGNLAFERKLYGNVYAPNGIQIRETSVYADITFQAEVKNGMAVNCHRQLLSEVKKK